MRNRHWLVGLLWLAVVMPLKAEAVSYSFGVVPQQAAAELADRWVPLLRYLEQRSGLALRFKTAPDIPEFEHRLGRGEYDFAYMNPYHYVYFSRALGYQAFAREKGARLQGLLVVRKDSPIQDIGQLGGQNLAFPAPGAFAASVLPRLRLQQQGIAFTPHFVASHDSVFLAVAKGIYPAGGGVLRTFNNAAPQVREQLRILWRTAEYTPHPLAAHPRVPAAVRQALAQALYAMDADPAAAAVLQTLAMRGWEEGKDADWNDLRALPLEPGMAPRR